MHFRRQLTIVLMFALAGPLSIPSPEVGAAKKKAAKAKRPVATGKGKASPPAPSSVNPPPAAATDGSTPAAAAPATAPSPAPGNPPGPAAPPTAAAPAAPATAPAAPAAPTAAATKGSPAPPPAAPAAAATKGSPAPPPAAPAAAASKGGSTPTVVSATPPKSGQAAAPASSAASEPATGPDTSKPVPGPTGDDAARSGEARALQIIELAREGQRDQKAGRSEAARSKLRQACEDADRESLSGAVRAQIHLMYAWALLASGDTAAAQQEGERAADLDPRDAEVRRDVAELQRENGRSEAAAESAQRSLDLGLSGRDADEMRALAKTAQPSGFRARFRLDAGLSLGFDSNAAQGEDYQTIAGKSTRGAAKNQAARLGSVRIFRALREDPLLGPSVYQRAVGADYGTAQAAQNQAAMPLDLFVGARYRLLGSQQNGLSVGYQFGQLFMLVAQGADNNLLPSAETYHLQRHTLTVSGQYQPKQWLDLSGRLDGFVTLSGLQGFTPFQGGLQATASGVITESARWATKADIVYFFRQSFDEANDGYLSGHRLRIRVGQEMRLGWVRPMLSYRFTYDATGVLQVQEPLSVMYASSTMPTDPPVPANLGTYSYSAPLSYQGHQISASAGFDLPLKLQAQAALRYEFQLYNGLYSATYVGSAVGSIPALPPFALPDVQRADHRVMVEAGAQRALPYHLSVGLSYGLLANFSNVANALDNRTYTKHSVIGSVSYYF